MGINKFSDMTDEEFFSYYNLNQPQDCSATNRNAVKLDLPVKDTPSFWDWR
jgi:hypothetical protein